MPYSDQTTSSPVNELRAKSGTELYCRARYTLWTVDERESSAETSIDVLICRPRGYLYVCMCVQYIHEASCISRPASLRYCRNTYASPMWFHQYCTIHSPCLLLSVHDRINHVPKEPPASPSTHTGKSQSNTISNPNHLATAPGDSKFSLAPNVHAPRLILGPGPGAVTTRKQRRSHRRKQR